MQGCLLAKLQCCEIVLDLRAPDSVLRPTSNSSSSRFTGIKRQPNQHNSSDHIHQSRSFVLPSSRLAQKTYDPNVTTLGLHLTCSDAIETPRFKTLRSLRCSTVHLGDERNKRKDQRLMYRFDCICSAKAATRDLLRQRPIQAE